MVQASHTPTPVQMQVAAAAFGAADTLGLCGTKKRAMNTKQHDGKSVAMTIHLGSLHPFECGHDSLSSLEAKE